MRTVLFGLGTRGDLELLITLGRALLHNGHTVVIGAHGFYGPRVESSGLQFTALGHGTQEDLQLIIRGLAAYPSPLQRTQQYYLQWLKPQLASVQAELAKLVGQADYFASNLKMVFRRGHRLVPTARITYDLPHNLADLDKYGPICPEVLDLVALPKRLVDPDHRWDARFQFTGFWLPSATVTEEPLQRLVDFVSSMPAPVVVTMGSMAMFDANRFLQVICEAARQLDLPVVVVSSWSGMQASTESNVCIVDEAPYDWLFPRSRCVIHHGGCGTTAAVLAAGTLSVISPQISCQVDLAQTLMDNNLVLATIDAASVDSSGLVDVIQQVNNTSHQETLQQWKETIPLDMGAAGAARLVDNHYRSLSQ
jgi:UDP:flavonoid glycosyltransferase YjiC (YdhE family)